MSQLLLPAPRLQGLAQHDTRRSWQCRQLWGQRPSLERAEGCRWRARPAGSAAGGVVASAAGFHQSRMVATERSSEPVQRLQLSVRLAESDEELQAAAWLRAQSFYVYPPERAFAGELHQIMISEEEFAALKAARLKRKLDEAEGERSGCIVAVCAAAEVPGVSERLVLGGPGNGGAEAVVGTLDLHVARALQGELLIGNSSCAGYLANVCVATAARRRGVGEELLDAVRALARDWGVLDLYVHTMAVNEVAMRFYQKQGFVVEKEESSNEAHYRGRCLDGIEGRGRTMLLRDARL